ncbi:MAG: hypothetical protein LBG48_05255 [Rickettsiales bacterium]|jgi:hypothetical protein|nr:hypothetical protein [Rickettsiales bacterium]
MEQIKQIFENIRRDPLIVKMVRITKGVYKNFKFIIFGGIFVGCCVYCGILYNGRVGYSSITNLMNGNVKYVGNAILLKDNIFITTYNNIIATCQKRVQTNKMHYFVVVNGGAFYEVEFYLQDPVRNIALLKVVNNYKVYKDIDFFAVFSSMNKIDYVGDHVYISKSLNSFDGYFFSKYKVTGSGNFGFTVRSFDNARKNYGEAVLNERFELVGITIGNSDRGLSGRFKNKIEFIDANKIKRFLIENRIFYAENKDNVDLSKISGYLELLNGKVMCFEEKKVVPLVVERRR